MAFMFSHGRLARDHNQQGAEIILGSSSFSLARSLGAFPRRIDVLSTLPKVAKLSTPSRSCLFVPPSLWETLHVVRTMLSSRSFVARRLLRSPISEPFSSPFPVSSLCLLAYMMLFSTWGGRDYIRLLVVRYVVYLEGLCISA